MMRARKTHDTPPTVAALVALFAACSNDDARAPAANTTGDAPDASPPIISRGSCSDRDGDGFGVGCARGPDCDDANASVTRECVRCRAPETGCECDATSAPTPCNLDTGTTERGPDGVCHLGQRVCRNGAWSQCEAFEGARGARIFGVASPCFGQCDPSCQHVVDCVTADDVMPAGCESVMASNLPQAVYCPSGTPSGGVQPRCENRPGGPYARTATPLAWVDACAQPGSQTLLSAVDEGVASVTIPFSFSYWGVTYRSLDVTSNGVAQFSSAASQWVNTALPSPSTPNAVMAFWDDLVLRGGICVATVGSAPDRRLVLEWNDAGFYPAPDSATHLTFELALSESSQTVDVLYRTMQSVGDLATGSSATVGVQEGGGTRFDLVGFNTPGVVSAGAGFRWTPISNDQYCDAAVYRRTFEAQCPGGAVASIPTWTLLNVSSHEIGRAHV